MLVADIDRANWQSGAEKAEVLERLKELAEGRRSSPAGHRGWCPDLGGPAPSEPGKEQDGASRTQTGSQLGRMRAQGGKTRERRTRPGPGRSSPPRVERLWAGRSCFGNGRADLGPLAPRGKGHSALLTASSPLLTAALSVCAGRSGEGSPPTPHVPVLARSKSFALSCLDCAGQKAPAQTSPERT